MSGAPIAIAPLRGRGRSPVHRPGDRAEPALLGRLRGAGPVAGGEDGLGVGTLVEGQAGGPEVAGAAVLRGGRRVERQGRVEHLDGFGGQAAAEVVESRPAAGDAGAAVHPAPLLVDDLAWDVLRPGVPATVLGPGPGEGVRPPGP